MPSSMAGQQATHCLQIGRKYQEVSEAAGIRVSIAMEMPLRFGCRGVLRSKRTVSVSQEIEWRLITEIKNRPEPRRTFASQRGAEKVIGRHPCSSDHVVNPGLGAVCANLFGKCVYRAPCYTGLSVSGGVRRSMRRCTPQNNWPPLQKQRLPAKWSPIHCNEL